jgi:hypothetical protein
MVIVPRKGAMAFAGRGETALPFIITIVESFSQQ